MSQDITKREEIEFPVFIEQDKEIIYRLKIFFKEKNNFIFNSKRFIVNKLPFGYYLNEKFKKLKSKI